MTRNTRIDTMKGLSILAVVLFHSGFSWFVLYPFHNTIFFMISGFLWKDDCSNDRLHLKKFVFRKIKTLWLPYVIANGFWLLLNDFLCYTGIYLCDDYAFSQVNLSTKAITYELHFIMGLKNVGLELCKIFLFTGATELGGATGFLRILFLQN